MASILTMGSEHLAKALDGEPEALRALFRARVMGWGKPYAHEEHVTVGLFSDVEEEIDSSAAFSAFATAADLSLEHGGEGPLLCAIALLQSLARATHTTEIPAPLKSAFPVLLATAKSLGSSSATDALADLRRYYRNAL